MRCRTASWPWPRWTRTLDHVRGSPVGRVILEYGDYQYPYSRQAFHAIELAGQLLGGNVRFAFRHFPLTGIHPHALAAAAAAEAAARQGRFWDCTSCCSAGERRSKTATCAGTPSNSGWMWPRSTTTRPARRCWRGSAATWTAVGRRPGAGGAHSVRRRRPAPRRLRSAHPAGRSRRDGLMTLPAHGRRILPMLATIGPPPVACLGSRNDRVKGALPAPSASSAGPPRRLRHHCFALGVADAAGQGGERGRRGAFRCSGTPGARDGRSARSAGTER